MEEVSVKLYSPNGGGDIRRFPFQVPKATNDISVFRGIYTTLLEKVKQILRIEGNSDVQLTWKDEEGDFIVMNTDLEVKEALRQRSSGDIFRIYPRLSTVADLSQQEKASEVSEISTEIGVEATDTTAKPAQEAGPPQHGHVTCDGCNEQGIRGIRFKCLICPDFDLCATCEGKHTHDQHPMLRISSPQDSTWVRAFRATQRASMEGSGIPFGHHFGHFPRHGGHGTCPRFGQFAERRQQQQQGANNTGNQQEEQRRDIPGAQFLREVGQAVAAVLNGLGIDVDVDVEHPDGQRTKVASPKSDKQEEKPEEKKPGEKKEENVDEQKDRPNVEVTTQDQPMTPPEAAAAQAPVVAEKVETPTNPADTQQDWTLLDSSDAAPIPTAPAATASASAQSEPQQRIDAALAIMMNMGFTNDGGWLTQLLEAKNGDISAVLDILHPSADKP